MKSIFIICAMLIASSTCIYAAAEEMSWTADELLLESIAYKIGRDGFNIAIYNNPTSSPDAHPLNNRLTKNFGFALVPEKERIPSGYYTESVFVDNIITRPNVMFFRISNDTTLTTEHGTQSISAYTYAISAARKFLLLCPYEERRNHMGNELEKSGNTFATIKAIATFLDKRMPDSTFVVLDTEMYAERIIDENIALNKIIPNTQLPDISSPAARRSMHKRRISF